ncbi:hypothetical protein QOT17_007755 [Balamuthia mandrillaris]
MERKKEENNVLIVGNPAKAALLLQAILGGGELNLEGESDHVYELDTKYYTTTVNLCYRKLETIIEEQSNTTQFDGLILLFDELITETLRSGIAQYRETNDPGLCLGVYHWLENKSEADKDDFNGWCIENGFEYVEYVVPGSDYATSKEDEPFAEKVGIDRVIEALEANLWSSMTMKPRSGPRSFNDSATLKEGEEEEDSAFRSDIDTSVQSLLNSWNNLILPSSSSASSTLPSSSSSSEENRTSGYQPLSTEELIRMSLNEDETARDEKREGGDEEAEEEAEGTHGGDERAFERALLELRSLRDKTKDLPDKERREVAARVALAFASSLGFGSEEL